MITVSIKLPLKTIAEKNNRSSSNSANSTGSLKSLLLSIPIDKSTRWHSVSA